MGAPLVTLTEIKDYLGKTGTDDDVLIASIASNASIMAERDTSRVFAVTSNTTYRYSTDGMASVMVHDRPYSDATRTVQLSGATMTEGVNCWFLTDRRNPEVATFIQVRPYSRDWYSRSFAWFDANWDNPKAFAAGDPNDLVITGTVGHPTTPPDVKQGVLELAAWLYHRAKGGASGYSDTLAGTEVDLTLLPMAYQVMVRNWKVNPGVGLA